MNKINNLDKIIIIESDLVYKFKKIIFIKNEYHDFDNKYSKLIDYIITDYIIDLKYNIEIEKVCIIKSNISNNITSNGIVSQDLINKYCYENNLISIEPTNYNEIEFINILYNCKEFVVSWGTSFFKNFHYISNKCNLIKVLVYTECFISQYNNHKLNNSIISNYKKANIEYIMSQPVNKKTVNNIKNTIIDKLKDNLYGTERNRIILVVVTKDNEDTIKDTDIDEIYKTDED
jgi:hypothetical protein